MAKAYLPFNIYEPANTGFDKYRLKIMKTALKLSALLTVIFMSNTSNAAQINQQLACKAHLNHIEQKLESLSQVYSSGALLKVRNGVKAYEAYLLEAHITPGMKEFPQMQAQVDQMQDIMRTNYDKQFADSKFFSNNAVIVQGCYEQFSPDEAAKKKLVEQMIDTILKLAQQ